VALILLRAAALTTTAVVPSGAASAPGWSGGDTAPAALPVTGVAVRRFNSRTIGGS
jgi:hypothetical protein